MKKFFLLIIASFAIILTGCGGGGDASLKSLIVGHKYYWLDDDTSNGSTKYIPKEIMFDTNGTAEFKDSEEDDTNYIVNGNTITFTKKGEKGSKSAEYITKTDKGLVLKDSETGEKLTLYFTKELAQNAAKEKEKQDNNASVKQCQVNGNTVLVNEGETCKHETDTATCQNNIVTVDNSLSGKSVTINGITYTCN